jgi:hypothetical protein
MTPADLHRLDALGITVHGFAQAVGVDYATARGWGGQRNGRPQATPAWVNIVLAAWERTVAVAKADAA